MFRRIKSDPFLVRPKKLLMCFSRNAGYIQLTRERDREKGTLEFLYFFSRVEKLSVCI